MCHDLARGQKRHHRTGKRANSLDTTLFLYSGRYYARFLVAIKTPGICVNFALINEIMLFEIIAEFISGINWFISLFKWCIWENLGLSTLVIEQGLK